MKHISVKAEPSIVKPFTNKLIAAYDGFIHSFSGTVDYIDGVMALINTVKAVITHMNEQQGNTGDFWARTFVNTLAKSLDLPWHSEQAERWVITSRDGTIFHGFSLAQTKEACIQQYEIDFQISWDEAYKFGWRCRKVHIYIVEEGGADELNHEKEM